MARKSSSPPSRQASTSARSHQAPPPARTPPPAARVPPPAAPAPVAQQQTAAMPQQQGSMLGGLMGGVIQGMAWGTGTTIARHAVDSAIGAFSGSGDKPQSVEQSKPISTLPESSITSRAGGFCDADQTAFLRCMQENKGNAQPCEYYFTALQQCQMNTSN